MVSRICASIASTTTSSAAWRGSGCSDSRRVSSQLPPASSSMIPQVATTGVVTATGPTRKVTSRVSGDPIMSRPPSHA